MHYDNKILIPSANLVENMWLTRYPRTTEMTYEQGSEFIGHEFRKSLTEIGYGITAMTSTLVNSNFTTILKWVHHFI